MQTIDFHAHLLNPNVSFSRVYDKVAISLFAKKLGVNKDDLLGRKYDAFVEAFINNIQTSKYVTKSIDIYESANINLLFNDIYINIVKFFIGPLITPYIGTREIADAFIIGIIDNISGK